MPTINGPHLVSSPTLSPVEFEAALTSSTSTQPETVDTFERVNTTTARAENTGSGLSALQKHVMFFDRDGDGSIGVSETYAGLRALGFDAVRSGAFSLAINAGLGAVTGAPWYAPLTVGVANIAKAKHGSDTDIYDDNGEFNPAKFEQLFATYDTNGDNALSAEEFEVFYARNREDSASSIASTFEFGLLLEIAGEERFIDGEFTNVVTRDTMARFYDGSLFFDIAGEPLPF